MAPDPQSEQSIPPELSRELEDGTYLGTCDWGYCHRDQFGWAQSDSDPSGDWLAICAECAAGHFHPANDEPFPVDRLITFEQVEASWQT